MVESDGGVLNVNTSDELGSFRMIRVDRGYEIYVFPNGNSAYKRFKVYKVYESKDAAINAIKIYLRTEVVGRTGFIRDFREDEL